MSCRGRKSGIGKRSFTERQAQCSLISTCDSVWGFEGVDGWLQMLVWGFGTMQMGCGVRRAHIRSTIVTSSSMVQESKVILEILGEGRFFC